MKVLVLYRPNSDHGRKVEEFIDSLQSRASKFKVESMNIDSREGSATAMLYDIMQYPAVLVTQDNGSAHKVWQGPEAPPLLSEVVSYAYV